MSAGHYMFYSDADDASLPAKKVLSMSKGNARDRSQRKWAPALVDAWTLSRQLRTTWTLVIDDDTFVAPRNVMRVLADYDAQVRQKASFIRVRAHTDEAGALRCT
eukprot:942943-Pleurochrysis_carterae.AAC.1